MKTKRAVQSLLFSVAALALSACSDQRQEPAPKTAEIEEVRSADEAKSHFLKGIDWSSRPQARAVLYTELLSKNSTVADLSSEQSYHSFQYEWFALVDYEPGAYFRHPVVYSFLSYEKPRVSQFSRTNLPSINYERPWSGTRQLLEDENVFYDRSWLQRPHYRDPDSILGHKPLNWPPRMMADKCSNEKRAFAVLIHNLPDLAASPETIDNLENMAIALEANGYNVQQFVSDPATNQRRPYLDLAAPKGNGIYQLINFVSIHEDFNDCCEQILVYVTGETTVEKLSYTEEVSLDIPFPYSGADGKRKAKTRLYPEDLAALFGKIKTCHLNFVVDTNNAGGFAADLLKSPHTESVLTACRMHEYTYSSAVETLGDGSFEDTFGLKHGETGSEFTSSVVKALLENASSRTESSPPDPAALLAKAAFESVKLFDISYLAGKTTPALEGRTLDSGCACGIETQLTQH